MSTASASRRLLARLLLVTLTAGIFGVAGCGGNSLRGATAERWDLRLNVLADGSIEVVDTLAMTWADERVVSFERHISNPNIDDVIDVVASLDGKRLPEGDGVDHTRITRSPSLHVRWQFAPAANRARTFTLQFRATGALALEGSHGVLQWDARPIDPGLEIGPSRIDFTVPPNATFIERPAIAQAGWRLASRPDGFTAEKSALGPEERATVTAVLAADSLTAAEPTWQYNAGRAGQLMPAFLAAGPFLLVVGIGVIALMRVQYPRDAPASARPGALAATSEHDVAAARLDDRERATAARGLVISGWVAIGLGVATGVAVQWLMPTYGPAPLTIPVSLLIVGVMFIVERRRFPTR